jgi:predicted acyltransferase (DUF342 family)
MAEMVNDSRRGAANLGVPLMVVTFLLVGGFMYWLYVTAEPTQPAVVEVTEDEVDDFVGISVSPEELKTGADNFVGEYVRLRDVAVSSTMGAQAFFVDLPASETLPATPFLVRMTPDAIAAGAAVGMGETATVIGTVITMNDSIVSDWVGNGVISENDQLLVEFATHFIEAAEVDSTPAAEGAAEAGA